MSGKPMRYPYTLSAQIAHFPFNHYYNHKRGWILKYWMWTAVGLMPVWYFFQKLTFQPENVKKWDEIHRKQFSGEMHH
ncbi:reduction of Rh1 [Osmia lignaria lignaria]|uniref:uncharacterized protein LOC117602704 n=1 Tax=Osmia lignaria TaxID=473952 RepID=UPI00147916A1|nr:uncharacterized protein LOC117602704 [Osmia lignaria]XP_034176915.1 uncharacterized protein LOC117602704 [Osmia lignaria]XP_034176917.1 uncharacterized protein LOC117602704 [Osmia lignaria]XP_034176918.1 uncharacterized protein LOC117602704 [Osmia lignaria]